MLYTCTPATCDLAAAAAPTAAAAEPSVLRFIMLAYLLILKEQCWVARKSVIKFRISAEARHVVSSSNSSSSSTWQRAQQQRVVAAMLGMSLHLQQLILHPAGCAVSSNAVHSPCADNRM
jgi:hypothetical protein